MSQPDPQNIITVTLTPNNINSRLCRDPTTFTSLACIMRKDAGAASQTSGPNMMFDAPAMLFCSPDDEANLKAEEEEELAKAAEQGKLGDSSSSTGRGSLDKDRQSQPIFSKYWMKVFNFSFHSIHHLFNIVNYYCYRMTHALIATSAR